MKRVKLMATSDTQEELGHRWTRVLVLSWTKALVLRWTRVLVLRWTSRFLQPRFPSVIQAFVSFLSVPESLLLASDCSSTQLCSSVT